MSSTTRQGDAEFARFWESYPRKVGKLAAEKVYRLVRKNGATASEIRDGLGRYLTVLPTDRRWIPHARTWLAQGRWMDEENTIRPQPARPFTAKEIDLFDAWRRAVLGCGHPERCETRVACMTKYIRHLRGEAA